MATDVPYKLLISEQTSAAPYLLLQAYSTGAGEPRLLGSVKLRVTFECRCVAVAFHLEVLPEYRRQGVARFLMDALSAHAASLGVSMILATVNEDNIASRSLCQQCGYVITQRFWNPHTGNELLQYVKVHRKD